MVKLTEGGVSMVRESIPKEGKTLKFRVINMMVRFIAFGLKQQY